MFSIFKKKSSPSFEDLHVDLHSHLIPGVDDGVQNFEEALKLIHQFEVAGYTKVITSPHIMQDMYDNKESDLQSIHKDIRAKLKEQNSNIEIELAAEYFLDDNLVNRMNNPEESFLTFGNNYLLFETSFMNEPLYIKEFVFAAKTRGINPVLAHPERYLYLHNNQELVEDLRNRQVLFQLNINSLSGFYSKQVKKFAEQLIDKRLVDFAGSDCHNHNHFNAFIEAKKSKYYPRLMQLDLINRKL